MNHQPDPLSPRSLVAGLIVTVVGGVAVFLITTQRTPEKPRSTQAVIGSRSASPAPDPDQRATFEVYAERAEHNQVAIRIVIAAKLRNTDTEVATFKHLSGYFVSDDGTKYTPGLASMQNEPIDLSTVAEIRRGETYRYSLGPVDAGIGPTSDEIMPIKKVTAYLDGLPPKQLQLNEAWWPRPGTFR